MAVSIISGVILKMCAGIKNPRWTSSRLRILCRGLGRQSVKSHRKTTSNLSPIYNSRPTSFRAECFKGKNLNLPHA
ncbi:Uncharacterised protein [Vibrio cholerae]|nr:Uncharacterised protein [Vibrio cholerae]